MNSKNLTIEMNSLQTIGTTEFRLLKIVSIEKLTSNYMMDSITQFSLCHISYPNILVQRGFYLGSYSMPCLIITHVYIFWYFIRNILTGGYIFSIIVFTLSRDFQTELGTAGGPEVRFRLARLP